MKAKFVNSIAFVFDFDDCLIKDTAKSHLYRNGKYIKSFTPDQFHHYIKKPNEEFDFSEFNNPKEIKANKGPIWNLLVKQDNLNKHELFILTSRHKEAKPLIYDFIIKNGIKNLPIENIYCVGNQDLQSYQIPGRKKEIIIKYLQPVYDKIYVYDDNDLTINNLNDIPKVYPILVKNEKYINYES